MSKITEEDLKRIDRCCCKQCGGPLKMKLIVYDPYGGHDMEMYCEQCGKIEYGTEKEVYDLAARFIDTFQFNYFLDMVEDERSEQLNIAKMCEIISWVLSEIGLIDSEGLHKDIVPHF